MPPAIVSHSLDALIEKLAAKSKRTWEHRGNKETDKNFQHVWNRLKARDGGIIYEVNEAHPIFRRLIEKFPACEDNFKKLLKLIAMSLPLNQIMLDLQSSNVEINNFASYSEENIREILKICVDGLSNGEVNKRLDELAKDVIFKNYPQLIKEFRKDEVHD